MGNAQSGCLLTVLEQGQPHQFLIFLSPCLMPLGVSHDSGQTSVPQILLLCPLFKTLSGSQLPSRLARDFYIAPRVCPLASLPSRSLNLHLFLCVIVCDVPPWKSSFFPSVLEKLVLACLGGGGEAVTISQGII